MKTRIQKFVLCLVLILPFALANGAVNLVFNTPTQNITPGGTFNITLSLQTTAGEQVTGVDYYLQELSAAGFAIMDRNMAASPFNGVVFFDDPAVPLRVTRRHRPALIMRSIRETITISGAIPARQALL